MTRDEFINELCIFVQAETQWIITELQKMRFANQGQFNDHEKWQSNRPDVKFEKYDQPPLIDSGELMAELTNPANWDVTVKRKGNRITLTIPDKEDFTDSKYDKLDTGGIGGEYTGQRTGRKIKIKNIPARPFKELSEQDIDWIVDNLGKKIVERFS